jgi:hypothetical protein
MWNYPKLTHTALDTAFFTLASGVEPIALKDTHSERTDRAKLAIDRNHQ